MKIKNNRLVWLDLEMTGLNIKSDVILEIATIVTDNNLEVIAEGPCIATSCPQEILAGMDEWNTTHHTSSGLVDRVKASTISMQEAENQTLDFLTRHLEKNQSPLCGNSICTDRRFLNQHMPDLSNFFHYRHIDVSSFKEVINRCFPDSKIKLPRKTSQHLALSDAYDSIAELKFYRDNFMHNNS